MRYAIVYSSRTGNTRRLAEALREALPAADCVYFGEPDPRALEAETIYLGFWTDKGSCDEAAGAFLGSLSGQRLFLFGTAGFGGAPEYFEKILSGVRAKAAPTVKLVGSYMCQGQMPPAVRQRYEAMEESPRRQAMLENFDRALGHPDQADLAGLLAAVGAAGKAE
jgi:flavodoxin I